LDVHINLFAIIVAAIASYVIAALWYALIFRKQWQKLSAINDMKPSALNAVLSLVGSVVMSFVLFHLIVFSNGYLHVSGIAGGLIGGFHGWLGFVAPVTLMTKLYEKKPWGLWLLDNGFWLISLLVMGSILSVWM